MPAFPLSPHAVLVLDVLRLNRDRWWTNRQLVTAIGIERISPRTVRALTRRFSEAGLLDAVPAFPATSFQWSASGAKKHRVYLAQLARVAGTLKQ